MLWGAATASTGEIPTLERDPDTYWYVLPAGYFKPKSLYVMEGWTITPPMEALSAPAAAPALVKAAAPAQVAKDVPALSYSARQKAEMPARHQAPMNPEKPARFK